MKVRFFFHAVVIAALASSAAACHKEPHGETGESAEASFGKLTVDELVSRMNDAKAGKLKLAIFDNNQHEVFNKGHIPTAHWVDFKNVQASDLPADKDTELVFYCANEHWTACHNGAVSAVKLGYKKVYVLPPGIMGWEKAGKPVERS